MPHFIIDCSDNIITKISPNDIMKAVYDTAKASGLFASGDIKVRLRPFQYYKLADTRENFIHIFEYIMEGRTTEQKANLSNQIISKLKDILRHVSFLSMNLDEFEKATYCNLALINPDNQYGDRHYGIQ